MQNKLYSSKTKIISQQSPLEKIGSHYVLFLAMIFVVINTSADILAYRMTTFGPLLVSVGVFIVPLSYACSDIIAEVYGYNLAKTIIWLGILNEFLFNLICYSLNLFSPPNFLHNQTCYINVLSPLLRVYFGVLLANIISMFANIYFLSKWKILLKGRGFWWRSIISSSIGDLSFTIICDIIVFIGTMPSLQVLRTIGSVFFLKVICAMFLAYPATLIVKIIKKKEKLDTFDYNINYNPFKLG